VAGLAPIGCAGGEPPALPVPGAALEGTYVRANSEARGVALVLTYPDEATAQRFMRAQARIVRGCAEPPGGVRADDPLTLVIEPREVGADRVVDVRRERGADASPLTWTEVVRRAGSRVALLTVGVAGGEQAPGVPALDRALDRALAQR
jgi:hypothetical protein